MRKTIMLSSADAHTDELNNMNSIFSIQFQFLKLFCRDQEREKEPNMVFESICHLNRHLVLIYHFNTRTCAMRNYLKVSFLSTQLLTAHCQCSHWDFFENPRYALKITPVAWAKKYGVQHSITCKQQLTFCYLFIICWSFRKHKEALTADFVLK